MRRILLGSLCALTACGPGLTADFSFSADRLVFDGRSQRAIVEVDATDERGATGTGVVVLTAGVGSFIEGNQIALVSGKGSATFRCNPFDDPACAGPVRLGATWKGVSHSLNVRVTPSDPTSRPLWRVVPTLQATAIHSAAKAPDGTVYAVGDRGLLLPFRISTGWGEPISTGVTTPLRAITVAPDGALTLAGDDGVILTGPPMGLRPLQHGSSQSFTSVLVHQGTVYVGTAVGSVGRYDVNDLIFVDVSQGRINALESLPDAVVAAGDEGLFRSSNGEQWTSLSPPVLARWVTVHSDTDGLWALGKRVTQSAEPLLVRGPGPDWTSASLPPGEVQAMTWGIGSADRYVATDVSVFRQQAGAGWEDLEAPAGGRAIIQLGGLSVLVVGPPGVSLLRVR